MGICATSDTVSQQSPSRRSLFHPVLQIPVTSQPVKTWWPSRSGCTLKPRIFMPRTPNPPPRRAHDAIGTVTTTADLRPTWGDFSGLTYGVPSGDLMPPNFGTPTAATKTIQYARSPGNGVLSWLHRAGAGGLVTVTLNSLPSFTTFHCEGLPASPDRLKATWPGHWTCRCFSWPH